MGEVGAIEVIADYKTSDFGVVKNKAAYLMGCIKKRQNQTR